MIVNPVQALAGREAEKFPTRRELKDYKELGAQESEIEAEKFPTRRELKVRVKYGTTPTTILKQRSSRRGGN